MVKRGWESELQIWSLHVELSFLDRKQWKLEQVPTSTRNSRRRYSSSSDFYKFEVEKNIRDFGINFLLQDDNHFSKAIEICIENYLNSITLSSMKTEKELQNIFNTFIKELLLILHDSTVLKYFNTTKDYLDGKCPDCAFMFKYVNMNIEKNKKDVCLQDFIIYLGELKGPKVSIETAAAKGQILQYLQILLELQDRKKSYGLLANSKYLKFFYVEKKPSSDEYNYYESRTL
ncbi:unnamed protein product [Rotaria sp. Silwood1]|nr:unnamed protein product [Rotaria sp. Silwood1]